MNEPTTTELLKWIATVRVIPVVEIESADVTVPLVEALIAAGLDLVEITLRTRPALDAIRAASTNERLLVGAGTVINAAQVDAAAAAGARFIVSPGISAEVVERCRELGLLCLPGVATPTDIMAAIALGLDTLKLFPAGTIGGPAAVKALSGPFPQVRFIPTGGITAETARSYLDLPSVLAVGGSWMVPRAAMHDEDWASVRRLAAEAIEIASVVFPKGA
jgi:2-dehydro-3-deoxyphosphogluconate aldolase/(4S)-4-hydroxy-2-oxoglutarate aldolase